ncbi:MAG: DUF1549 domain-containing protein [Planctomycetes bacterium]|nr:DUF1549 domain-containing protein [Planctomycetota bacterium]
MRVKNQQSFFRLHAVLGMMLIAAVLSDATSLNASDRKTSRAKPARPIREFPSAASDMLVNDINEQIRTGWKDNEVTPSQRADDSEWLRRVYLDIVGHIPPYEVVESFLAEKDKHKTKRAKLIDRLLDDPDYVRNWTTIWTNLSIGRQTPRRVSRAGMQKFFREAFAKNRPWNDVVYDLVTAEGHFDENGAVNFLLAQMTMRDEAVQATAKTTRLFLGIQVQCTQCHNHPFNDWKQNQFWEFNSFFRQARRVNHRKYDPKSGRQVDDYSELVKSDFSGPVYFEKRNAVMEVAYPKFFGEGIAEMLEQSAEAALRDTEQITEITIPDLFVPVFGSSLGSEIPVELQPEIKDPDGIDVAIIPEGSDVAIYMVPVRNPGMEQNQDDELTSDGMLFLAQFSEAGMSKEHIETWTEIKRMLELAESAEKDKEANESIIIHRSIRDESATFLLSRELDDNFGGKEAWKLLGFFRGKESQAAILMIVNTDRLEKEQIVSMIDSIR